MIRRLLLFLVIFGISAARADSQILISLIFGDLLNSEKVSFGLTGGAHIATITNLTDARYTPKFNLGFFFDVRLGESNWYAHPEVLVKSTMGTHNLYPYPTSDPELDTLLTTSRIERRINYFNVPLLIKYRISKWGVEAGPQFSLRTKATDEFKTDLGDKEELLLRKDIRDQIDRLDAGFAAGLSWKIGEGRSGMTILGRYYFGLVDIDNLAGGKQANQSFLINVMIPIGAGEKEAAKTESLDPQDLYRDK